MPERQGYNLEIIAGPCSVDSNNIAEIHQIADLRANGRPAIYGTRVVGLKSRTAFDPQGMGMDYEAIMECNGDITPPSAEIAEDIFNETGLLVSTEVMLPDQQVPHYIGRIPKEKLLLWNPSVMQLGHPIKRMARYAEENGWRIGIKNGKALGVTLDEVNTADAAQSPMEKTWLGLVSYAQNAGQITIIHRGVDIPEKGNYRNALTDEAARRVKRAATEIAHAKGKPRPLLLLDPSHAHGPKMRDSIVEDTVKRMIMKDRGSFLYDGVLIEAGTSSTDTDQHVTIAELEAMVKELGTFRILRAPEYRSEHTFYQYSGRKEKVEAVAD